MAFSAAGIPPGVSLVAYTSGLGSTAWQASEPDAPGLFALVYATEYLKIPIDPNTEDLTFAVFRGSGNESIGTFNIEGRAGLNLWYREHVGYEPDKEPDGEVPILELIDNVAGHILLRCFEEGKLPSVG